MKRKEQFMKKMEEMDGNLLQSIPKMGEGMATTLKVDIVKVLLLAYEALEKYAKEEVNFIEDDQYGQRRRVWPDVRPATQAIKQIEDGVLGDG